MMPEPGPPRTPDYAGGGIVNLMASIVAARGGRAWHPTLDLLEGEGLAGVTNLVLLVIDGLGAEWLASRSPEGLLSRHRLGPITTVFPSTTATAITTFLTGEAPTGHGLTGWHTWVAELGCVLKVLPGTPRYGGASYAAAGVDPMKLFGHRSLFERIEDRSFVVTPAHIARSDFNLAHARGARVVPYKGLKDLFRRTARIIRWERGRKFLYCYWSELDHIGHEQGMWRAGAAAHLAAIEAALTDFLARIAGTDTAVLVTADHGQIDTKPGDVIDLADHPELEACLALPLCGEPRAAFAYLKNGREGDFLAYCAGPLAGLVEVHPSADLRARGLFGPEPAQRAFASRIGDWTLLPTGNRVLRQRLPLEEPHTLIGQHGGLSSTEVLVPLCVLRG